VPEQAVRFDAAGEDYVGPLALGATFTILLWARVAADRDTYSTIFGLDNNVGTLGACTMQTIFDGTALNMTAQGGTDQSIHTMAVGTWYCYAVTRTAQSGPTALRVHWGTAPDALTLVEVAATGGWGAAGYSQLRLGESAWSGEWLDGDLAFVKIYTRPLDESEIETELSQYAPGVTTDLHAAYSFWDGPSNADLSGNGRDLAGGSGAATDAGPVGIPYLWSTTETHPSPRAGAPVVGVSVRAGAPERAPSVAAGTPFNPFLYPQGA